MLLMLMGVRLVYRHDVGVGVAVGVGAGIKFSFGAFTVDYRRKSNSYNWFLFIACGVSRGVCCWLVDGAAGMTSQPVACR